MKHHDRKTVLDIKAWGNNLGVRLPASVAKAARLRVDQHVRITVEEGRVIITLEGNTQPTLADRLARFDPAIHGVEAIATHPAGHEVW